MTIRYHYLTVVLLSILPLFSQGHDEGFIYGRVYTDDGHYEGPIRWGKEEAYWCDLFNAGKNDNAYIHYLSDDDRERLADLLRELGKKQLVLQLQERLEAIPASLAGYALARMRFGHGLPHVSSAAIGLSDLLFYEAGGAEPVDSLADAIPSMKPGSRWRFLPGSRTKINAVASRRLF